MGGAPQNDTEKFFRKQKNPKLYQIIHFLRLTHTVDKYLFAGIIYAENVIIQLQRLNSGTVIAYITMCLFSFATYI
jgi:hypothetical protein